MHLYPEDHEKFSKLRYEEYMASGDSAIMVFESPSLKDPSVKKPIAFSIWQLPATHTTEKGTGTAVPENSVVKAKGPLDHLQRRDTSAERIIAFREAMGRAKTKYFDQKYGEHQLYLGMLACHPDYQRRGLGEALCKWGLEKGKAEGLNLTLFGSPMGRRLYERIGFVQVCSFRTQVEGEEEFWTPLDLFWRSRISHRHRAKRYRVC